MKKTEWMPPNTNPTRSGLYERDWTNTDILPVEDRCVSMDYWTRVPNPRDSLYPGVWYVLPEFNDASRQHLPWRGLERPNVELNRRLLASVRVEAPVRRGKVDMKVYVAEREYDCEGFQILGIFSTKEKAQEACDQDADDDGRNFGDSHTIEEFEIDA